MTTEIYLSAFINGFLLAFAWLTVTTWSKVTSKGRQDALHKDASRKTKLILVTYIALVAPVIWSMG